MHLTAKNASIWLVHTLGRAVLGCTTVEWRIFFFPFRLIDQFVFVFHFGGALAAFPVRNWLCSWQ